MVSSKLTVLELVAAIPIELKMTVGDRMRKVGNEFELPLKTKKMRWIDIPALKYAIMINELLN